jgi:hypothetical protein
VENRKVIKYDIKDIQDAYVNIYKSVFEQYDYDGNCPSIVYVGFEDEEIFGFISGYIQSPVTFYLQRAGFTKSEQRKFTNRNRFRFALYEIHKEWPYIMTLVKNTDNSALKLSLNMDFKIIGSRMDTGGNLWVEMIHSREG